MKKYKTYAWNRNAATHRDAVMKFSVMAYLMSFTTPIAIIFANIPGKENSNETLTYVVVAIILGHMVTFALTLAVMCGFYYLLNEQQARENPPTPPTPPRKKPVPVYSNGREKPEFYLD